MHEYKDDLHVHVTKEAMEKLQKEALDPIAKRVGELQKQLDASRTDETCPACESEVTLASATTEQLEEELERRKEGSIYVHVADELPNPKHARNDRAARRAQARGKRPK